MVIETTVVSATIYSNPHGLIFRLAKDNISHHWKVISKHKFAKPCQGYYIYLNVMSDDIVFTLVMDHYERTVVLRLDHKLQSNKSCPVEKILLEFGKNMN